MRRLQGEPDRAGCTTKEVALESEAGFRGVAKASAELRIWLPGSMGWPI